MKHPYLIKEETGPGQLKVQWAQTTPHPCPKTPSGPAQEEGRQGAVQPPDGAWASPVPLPGRAAALQLCAHGHCGPQGSLSMPRPRLPVPGHPVLWGSREGVCSAHLMAEGGCSFRIPRPDPSTGLAPRGQGRCSGGFEATRAYQRARLQLGPVSRKIGREQDGPRNGQGQASRGGRSAAPGETQPTAE